MKTKVFSSMILILFAFSFGTCKKENTSILPQESLIAYYPFNGNANDESGNGNNGIVLGATLTTDTCGNPNCAYYFDGNSQIDCGVAPQLNVSEITISVWLKFSTTSLFWQTIIAKYDVNLFGSYALALNYDKVNIWFTKQSGDDNINFNGNISILPDRWCFIVATHNATKTKIYVNGILDVENDEIFDILQAPNDHLRIGSQGDFYPVRISNGWIDNIRIYNRALSETEIQELYIEGGCEKVFH